MKRFCEYLLEKKLHEALHVVNAQNGEVLLNDFGRLLSQISDKQHTYIKVLKYENDEFKVYNLNFDENAGNFFELPNQRGGAPAKLKFVDDRDDEATARLAFQDFEAVQRAIDTTSSKLILHDDAQQYDFFIHYDDRINLVFLCIGMTNQQASSYVFGLISALQGMIDNSNAQTHVNGDHQHVEAAVQHYQTSPIVLAFLTPLVTRQEMQRHVAQPVQREVQQVDVTDVQPNQIQSEIQGDQGDGDQDDGENQGSTPSNAQGGRDTQEDMLITNSHGIRFRLVDSRSLDDFITLQQDCIVAGVHFTEFQELLRTLPQDELQILRGQNQDRVVAYKQISWDNAVDPLRRLQFMRISKSGHNDTYKVMFSCKKNAHKFLQVMTVPRAIANQVVFEEASVWGRAFLREWVRQYNNYLLEVVWDPDDIKRSLKHSGNRPGTNGDATAQTTQQRDTRAQSQQQRQPRQRRTANAQQQEQIEQIKASTKTVLQHNHIEDVDFDLIVGRTGRRGGIPRDENKYFVLKFPGVDPDVLVGDQAKTFLQELGAWDGGVKPAFDHAAQQINGLQLCITMNNRY